MVGLIITGLVLVVAVFIATLIFLTGSHSSEPFSLGGISIRAMREAELEDLTTAVNEEIRKLAIQEIERRKKNKLWLGK